MRTEFRNSNPELDLLSERLRDVRMSDQDRLIAEAHLARAEAIAELLSRFTAWVKRTVRTRVVRPAERLAESLH
jgi:hypothetical protein